MHWSKSEMRKKQTPGAIRFCLIHFSICDIVLMSSSLSDSLYSSINVNYDSIFWILLLGEVNWCRNSDVRRTLPGITTLLSDPWLFSIWSIDTPVAYSIGEALKLEPASESTWGLRNILDPNPNVSTKGRAWEFAFLKSSQVKLILVWSTTPI